MFCRLFDVALPVASGAALGQAVMTKGAFSPIAPAGRIIGQDRRGREVFFQRQSIEIGGRQCAEVRRLCPLEDPRRVVPPFYCPDEFEKGRFAFVEDRGIKWLQRLGQERSLEAKEDLRHGGAADGDMDAGQEAADHEGQGIGRLDLAGKGDGDADDAHPFRREAAAQLLEVFVEGVPFGAGILFDLADRQ